MLFWGMFPDIPDPPNGFGRSRMTTGIFDNPQIYNIWLVATGIFTLLSLGFPTNPANVVADI